MKNKEMINKLRDNAELAIAAYGYFHLADSKYDFNKDSTDKERLEYFREKIAKNQTAIPTPEDILNMEHKYFKDNNGKPKDSWYHKHFLGGDMTPTQAKRFFSRYDLLIHQPNTESGFSATLFKDTKADSKDSEYTLAIRGTEFKPEQIKDLINDYYIGTNNDNMDKVVEQYLDMLLFYEETLKPLLQEKGIAKINITGHSLGGYLTQLFALSYPHIINEVYTFNAPGVMSDKITNTLYWIAQGIGFFAFVKTIKFSKMLLGSLGSLFSSPKPFEAKDIFLNKSDKDRIVGIIKIDPSYKTIVTFKNKNNYDDKEQRIIHNAYTNDVPYFLRSDSDAFAHKNGQPIFYYKDIGKYANEFYELMSDGKYAGKYLYYQYTLHNSMTQASVAKFEYLILDYDLSMPYKRMVDALQYMIQNKQYSNDTIKDENVFRVVSLDVAKKMDSVGYLGHHTFGNDCPMYVGTTNALDTHSIIPLTQTLYFYSYLLELDSNAQILQANDNDISQCIERLNTLSNAIHKILEDASFQKATGYGEALQIPPTPHYLHAIIDKTLFEATLHTKQKKLQVDNTNLIEGILYLQDKGIFLQLLTEEKMQEAATNTALRESNLAILLAIHERLFFISVIKQDGQTQALIQTKDDIIMLLKHNTTRTKIFCHNLKHIDERLMKGYLNNAFRFYPLHDKKKAAS
ncbi:alpha/beta hydrolase [Helicobacter trogontum]|uniref:alpha/beta hydrolase n=1 Tax=Helicobacter trogontum TaxID=50960 RepID=UPI002A90B81C|nr:alpha/beta hydrolase [Helicobacter trogontum]MDY5186228.1 alpha/beta hydrolase [Helicobacter trogontum]